MKPKILYFCSFASENITKSISRCQSHNKLFKSVLPLDLRIIVPTTGDAFVVLECIDVHEISSHEIQCGLTELV